MPELSPKPNTSSTPATPAVADEQLEIKVMPEKLVGAALISPPASVLGGVGDQKKAASAAETKLPVPVPPSKPGAKKKTVLIAAIAGILLLGGGAAALIFLLPPKEPEVIIVPPPTPEPTPVPPPENENTNVVLNENTNTNANENANVPVVLRSGADLDSDGLTDTEEKTIYNTNSTKLDSDGDTFNDGNEVSHLFDPAIRSPALLNDSASVTTVNNSVFGYSVLAPASWSHRGNNQAEFFTSAPSGEFMEVLATTKSDPAKTLAQWYLEQSPGATESETERFTTKGGYDALRSPDRLITYIDAGDGRIFSLIYNIDSRSEIDFRTTYEMFVASFVLAPVQP